MSSSSISEPVPPPESAPAGNRSTTAAWLIPTMVYIVTLGGLGVTSKLALKHLQWQDLILWSGIGYLIVVTVMVTRGYAKIQWVENTFWAVVSAVFAIGGLVALYVALDTGQASKVVPISASYPAVTVVFSALFLGERITVRRVIGVALVIGGVVVISTL